MTLLPASLGMQSHRQIEDRAAALLAQRDSGAWTEDDQVGLTRWIEASTANRVAFLRLEAAWEEARRLKVFGAGLQSDTVPPPGLWRDTPFFNPGHTREASELHPPPVECTDEDAHSSWRDGMGEVPTRKSWFRVAAAAATLVLALVLGTYFAYTRGADRYSTPIGTVASVPLRDGSNITLNTSSQIRVELSQRARRVELEQGEAFFVVAKDPNRPFVVEAGNKRIVAVGTQFSVRRDKNDLRVVVTEGTVRLEPISSVHPAKDEGDSSHRLGAIADAGTVMPESTPLTAGTIAHASDGDVLVQSTSVSRAEEMLSWRQGFLIFHETTLAEAIEEFNRYNTHKITIEDPKVAAIRISGTFRPTNYEAFVRLLEDGYSIQAKGYQDTITLTRD